MKNCKIIKLCFLFFLINIINCQKDDNNVNWWLDFFSRNQKNQTKSITKTLPHINIIKNKSDYNVNFIWEYKGKWSGNWIIKENIIKKTLLELKKLEYEDIEYRENVVNRLNPKEYWKRIYRKIYSLNEDRVDNIILSLKETKDKYRFQDNEMILYILAFIQSIKYTVPDNYFGLITPPLIIASGKGDCDSKAILLITILKKLNYDAILFHSVHYKHAMVGVWFEGTGKYIEYYGKKYYFCETTQSGWLLGQLPPDVQDVKHWYPIEID